MKIIPFPLLTMEALQAPDWEPALTLPLPPAPDLRLLFAARDHVILFLQWVTNDLAQADPDKAKQEIQRAAARLIEIAALTPGAVSAHVEAGLEADHIRYEQERRRQLEEDAEGNQ
jgi:hypothetical protein